MHGRAAFWSALTAVTAWCGHTDASRADAQDLDAVLTEQHVKHETFAADMGLRLPQFCRQLAGTEPLNNWRLRTALAKHPSVALALIKRQASRMGATVLSAEEVAFVLGAVRLGAKRMAKILHSATRKRRSA